MRKNALRAALCFALLGLMAGVGSAAQLTYLMGDHPDGALYKSDGTPYGLRFDDQNAVLSAGTNLGGGGGPLVLEYDDSLTGDALLQGFIQVSGPGGAGGAAGLGGVGTTWFVTYTIANISAAPNGGFQSASGSGYICDPSDCGNTQIALTGKQDTGGIAFIFDFDGHRISGDNDDPIARGWIQGSGTNDWLLTATPGDFDIPGVPEPSTYLLFMTGAAVLFGLRRRKQS